MASSRRKVGTHLTALIASLPFLSPGPSPLKPLCHTEVNVYEHPKVHFQVLPWSDAILFAAFHVLVLLVIATAHRRRKLTMGIAISQAARSMPPSAEFHAKEDTAFCRENGTGVKMIQIFAR